MHILRFNPQVFHIETIARSLLDTQDDRVSLLFNAIPFRLGFSSIHRKTKGELQHFRILFESVRVRQIVCYGMRDEREQGIARWRLSRLRAEVVADYLVRLGAPRRVIKIIDGKTTDPTSSVSPEIMEQWTIATAESGFFELWEARPNNAQVFVQFIGDPI